jgi:heptosyltransferase II
MALHERGTLEAGASAETIAVSRFRMSATPKKILVRGLNWLGDAVMATPALARLRERYRDAQITILTHEKLGPLYSGHPAIDRVLMFSADDPLLRVAGWLRSERFDLGIALPNSQRSALELWLGGVKRRVGCARSLRSFMLTDAVRPPAGIATMRKRSEAEIRQRVAAGLLRDTYDAASHHALHYLHLVASLGCNPAPLRPEIYVAPDICAQFAARLDLPPGTRLFGLNAGAEYGPAKRWPEERFVEAAVRLHKAAACRWLVLGGKGELELASRIAAQIEGTIGREAVINVAGQTTLRQLCAALKLCDVVLTNDTGPMHLAAAVGTPVVVPFGSTSFELTGPGLPGAAPGAMISGDAACAPCFLRECPIDFRCMKSITVERVVEAVLAVVRR